jgi:hypothetical protein
VVYRDQVGNFLGASAITFRFITEPTTLEALAIREGQALAEDIYINQIQIASACKMVVNDVKMSSAEHGGIVHEIIESIKCFNSCNIVHEFRSSNFEVHNLAKHALTLGFGHHVWLGQPGELYLLPVNVMEFE